MKEHEKDLSRVAEHPLVEHGDLPRPATGPFERPRRIQRKRTKGVTPDWVRAVTALMTGSCADCEIGAAIEAALLQVAALQRDADAQKISALTTRVVAAEHHRALELLGRGSATEQLEMDLRTKLAEAELRLEAYAPYLQHKDECALRNGGSYRSYCDGPCLLCSAQKIEHERLWCPCSCGLAALSVPRWPQAE